MSDPTGSLHPACDLCSIDFCHIIMATEHFYEIEVFSFSEIKNRNQTSVYLRIGREV